MEKVWNAIRIAAPAVAVVLGTAGCSGGGGGGGGVTPACSGYPPPEAYVGAWQVEGLLLDADAEDCPPTGLEAIELVLTKVADVADEDACFSVFRIDSPDLDTQSAVGSPGTIFLLVDDEGHTFVDGVYYAPGLDVSVDLQTAILPGAIWTWDGETFTQDIEFEVYAGDQVEAVVYDVPGEDDDGDGEIDEADELDPEDAIAPGALLLCEGVIRLEGSRGGGGEPGPSPERLVLDGEARGERGPALALQVELARGAAIVRIGGLDLGRGPQDLEIAAPLSATGTVVRRVERGGVALELSGRATGPRGFAGELRLLDAASGLGRRFALAAGEDAAGPR